MWQISNQCNRPNGVSGQIDRQENAYDKSLFSKLAYVYIIYI